MRKILQFILVVLFFGTYCYAQNDVKTITLSDCDVVVKINDLVKAIDDFNLLTKHADIDVNEFITSVMFIRDVHRLPYDSDFDFNYDNREKFDYEKTIKESWLNDVFEFPARDLNGSTYIAVEDLEIKSEGIIKPTVYIMVPVNRDLLLSLDNNNDFSRCILSDGYAVFSNVPWDEQNVRKVELDVNFSAKENVVIRLNRNFIIKSYIDYTKRLGVNPQYFNLSNFGYNRSSLRTLARVMEDHLDYAEITLSYNGDRRMRFNLSFELLKDSELKTYVEKKEADATEILKYLPDNDYAVIYAKVADSNGITHAYRLMSMEEAYQNFAKMLHLSEVLDEIELSVAKKIFEDFYMSWISNDSYTALTSPFNSYDNRTTIISSVKVDDIDKYKAMFNGLQMMVDTIMIEDISRNFNGDYVAFKKDRVSIITENAANDFVGIDAEIFKFTCSTPFRISMTEDTGLLVAYAAFLDENIVLYTVGFASTQKAMISNMKAAIDNVRNNGNLSFINNPIYAVQIEGLSENPVELELINGMYLSISELDLMVDSVDLFDGVMALQSSFGDETENIVNNYLSRSSSNYSEGRLNINFNTTIDTLKPKLENFLFLY